MSQTLPKSQTLHLLFAVAMALEVIGEGLDFFWLRMLKPLPILLLLASVARSSHAQRGHLTAIALAFSVAGDVALMIDSASAFKLGCVLFMLAHLVYIRAFLLAETSNPIRHLSTVIGVCTVALSAALAGVVLDLRAKSDSWLLFSVYGLVLMLEALASLYRCQFSTSASSRWVIAGCLLFALSDNLLNYFLLNKIKSHAARAAIMLTYYAAQYCLVRGLVFSGTGRPHQDQLATES